MAAHLYINTIGGGGSCICSNILMEHVEKNRETVEALLPFCMCLARSFSRIETKQCRAMEDQRSSLSST